MATAEKSAAPDKGAAAVAETQPEPKTLEWRGLTLPLPAKVATMRLTATWRRLGKAAEAEDGAAVMGYLTDIVDVILGDDERQADRVWAKIDADGGDEAADVFDLVEQAMSVYGVEPGE